MSSFFELRFKDVGQHSETPDKLIQMLRTVFGIRTPLFDPAPPSPQFDGLIIPWKRRNFVNPPFSNALQWIQKAKLESYSGRTSYLLLPFKSDTRYMHRELFDHASCILLWLHPVRFKYFSSALRHTMTVFVFGKFRIDDASWLTSSRLHAWSFPRIKGSDGQEQVGTLFKQMFKANIGHAFRQLKGWRTDGVNVRVVRTNKKCALEEIAVFCNHHKNASVVLMVSEDLVSSYIVENRHLIRDIVLLSPGVGYDGTTRIPFATILICMGKPIERLRTSSKHRKIYMLKDPETQVVG